MKNSSADLLKLAKKDYLMEGHIAALFLDKADMSMAEYIDTVKGSKLTTTIMIQFYKDMQSALNYLHNVAHYIHNDIKLENIVIKNSTSKKPTFQLIDFGLAQHITDVNRVPDRIGGTKIYAAKTAYEIKTSVLYDWHCVLLCFLEMLFIGKFISDATHNPHFVLKSSPPIEIYDTTNGEFVMHQLLKDQLGNISKAKTIIDIVMANWYLYEIFLSGTDIKNPLEEFNEMIINTK